MTLRRKLAEAETQPQYNRGMTEESSKIG